MSFLRHEPRNLIYCLFLAAIFGCGCNQTPPAVAPGVPGQGTVGPIVPPANEQKVPEPEPKTQVEITYPTGKKPSGPVVLFVHGLMGGDKNYWKHPDAKQSWPELVAADPAFVGCTVAVFSYNSDFARGKQTCEQIARNLELYLKNEGLLGRKFVFVCHSMGGLIIREYLLQFPDQVENAQMLYLASTPMAGSDLGRLGELFTKNPQLGQLRVSANHDWADEQNAKWKIERKRRAIPIFAAYELHDTSVLFGIVNAGLVVTEESADRGATHRTTGIEADHLSICRPTGPAATVHVDLRQAYLETTTNICLQPVKELPSVDECIRILEENGYDKKTILREDGSSPKVLPEDVNLTVFQDSKVNACLVLCNAPALFRTGTNACAAYPFEPEAGRVTNRYLSRMRDPTGYVIVFLRYRDNDGVVKDDLIGVYDFCKTNDPYIHIARNVGQPTLVTASVKESTPPTSE